MPDASSHDRDYAVRTLLYYADLLPAALILELRKYLLEPQAHPIAVIKQRYACTALLDYQDQISDPLEAELYALLNQIDYAMNNAAADPGIDDREALDAVSGILRSSRRTQAMLEDIRAIVRRSGRGTAVPYGESGAATVTDINARRK
jgi:hypothetical protein